MLPELTHEQLADSSPIDFVVSFINANPGVLLVEYVNSEYLPERLLFMKQSAMAKTNDAKLRLRLEAMMQQVCSLPDTASYLNGDQWNASANRRRPCSDRCRPAKTSALPLPSMGPLVKIFPKASTKSAATSSGRRLEPGSMRSVSQNARLGLGLTANMKKVNSVQHMSLQITDPQQESAGNLEQSPDCTHEGGAASGQLSVQARPERIQSSWQKVFGSVFEPECSAEDVKHTNASPPFTLK